MDTQTEAADVETLIKAQEDWLRKMGWFFVRGYGTRNDAAREDAMQEGRLGMWKATQNYEPGWGTLEGWMRQNARWAMGQWLTKYSRVSEQTYGLVDENMFVDDDPSFDSVLSTFHNNEITESLGVLTEPEREYVVRRFWWGQIQPEISEAMHSKNPSGAFWSHPKYGAKHKLAKQLAHLKGVAA